MSDFNPQEIAQITIDKGLAKTKTPVGKESLLAFVGGAFISIGYLAYIRITGTMPAEWGGLSTFIGASVFPIGLILILLGGGELLTGNMMVVSMAYINKKISFFDMMKNWGIVAFFNLCGALFVAYFFGHVLGLTEGVVLEKTIAVAQAKVGDSFFVAFVSGIGCNWLVGMSVWLCYGTKNFSGKILAIWFPVMVFVLIGFQHVVANFFIIPAAIFAGSLSWIEFIRNVIPVFLGNAVGGSVFVSLFYSIAYMKKTVKVKEKRYSKELAVQSILSSKLEK
ncbi:MAG: formate/nitrite transporter family protein [Carnobacterium sp.]|nr:formate/nitrite transporter family protein [Carnobacterium sp.]